MVQARRRESQEQVVQAHGRPGFFQKPRELALGRRQHARRRLDLGVAGDVLAGLLREAQRVPLRRRQHEAAVPAAVPGSGTARVSDRGPRRGFAPSPRGPRPVRPASRRGVAATRHPGPTSVPPPRRRGVAATRLPTDSKRRRWILSRHARRDASGPPDAARSDARAPATSGARISGAAAVRVLRARAVVFGLGPRLRRGRRLGPRATRGGDAGETRVFVLVRRRGAVACAGPKRRCVRRGARALLNTSAKFWRLSRPAYAERSSIPPGP